MIDPAVPALLRLLADGGWFSRQDLATALQLEDGALSRCLNRARALSAPIEGDLGYAIRLGGNFVPLNADRIAEAIASAHSLDRGPEIQVVPVVDSTNEALLREREPRFKACLAEMQTAGRGRSGRQWLSPYGANLYLSLKWPIERLTPDAGCMSLACGVAVADILEHSWGVRVGIKWPNDIYCGGRKLGGILIEHRTLPAAGGVVVIGLGLNVSMDSSQGAAIDQPWVALRDLLGTQNPVDRNRLAGDLIAGLAHALSEFGRHGFAPFEARWASLDLLHGRRVTVHTANGPQSGIAEGVDSHGALAVRADDGLVRKHISGDVSVRLR